MPILTIDTSSAAEELNQIKETLSKLEWKNILFALGLLIVCLIAVKLILIVVRRVLRRTNLDGALYRFILSLLRIMLCFLSLLIVASSLGINVTSLLALFSVVSLAISLSVQNVLSNVAGGLMLIGAKPFKKGDFVSIEEQEGTVEEVTIAYTKLRTLDNRLVMIPNSKVSNALIQNYTKLGKRRLELVVAAAYDSDPARVMEALHSAVDRLGALPEEPVIVEFQEFGDSAISYHVCAYIPSGDYIEKRYLLRRLVWEEFQNAGVKMTYPHLNVHLERQ